MMRFVALLAMCAAHAEAFAVPGFCAPSLVRVRPALQATLPLRQATLPLRQRSSAALSMAAVSQGFKSNCKRIVASAALSLCLLAGAPVKSSAGQSAATDFDFEEDLMEDETSLVGVKSGKSVEIEYTGMRKLTFQEECVKYGILVGIFGGGVAWSWWEGKREDREEEARVKAEVERIEKWKKEFIDMDDVVSDEDMLSSLNKRLSGESKEDVEGLDGTGAVPQDYNPDTVILQQQMKKLDEEQKKKQEQKEKDEEDRFSALQKELSEEQEEDKVAQVDAEQMERLKRMFGGSAEGGDAKDAKK